MFSMTRVRLAALLLFVAGVCPAYAGGPVDLVCVAGPTDQDSGASGFFRLFNVQKTRYGTFGDVTVTCKGLTPGATYQVGVWGWDYYRQMFSGGHSYVVATTRGEAKVTIRWLPSLMVSVSVSRAGDVPVGVLEYAFP